MDAASPNKVRDRYVAALEEENETLRERVRQLEEMLGFRLKVPMLFGLTGRESEMLGFLLERDIMTRHQLLTALYGHRPPEDEPEMKIIDVWACKMRRKLKPFGVKIYTKWGSGYYLDKDGKAKVQQYLEAETGAGI